MERTIIRNACEKDLEYVAKIHKQLFFDHYLGGFSIKLIGKFYKCFINDNVVFLVSVTNGQVTGFVLGGNRNEVVYCKSIFMKKNILLNLIEVLSRPKLWIESFKKLIDFFRSKNKSKSPSNYIKDYTLLSIGVSPSFQGKGLAKMLVAEFDVKIYKYANEYSLTAKEANLQAPDLSPFNLVRFYMLDNQRL